MQILLATGGKQIAPYNLLANEPINMQYLVTVVVNTGVKPTFRKASRTFLEITAYKF